MIREIQDRLFYVATYVLPNRQRIPRVAQKSQLITVLVHIFFVLLHESSKYTIDIKFSRCLLSSSLFSESQTNLLYNFIHHESAMGHSLNGLRRESRSQIQINLGSHLRVIPFVRAQKLRRIVARPVELGRHDAGFTRRLTRSERQETVQRTRDHLQRESLSLTSLRVTSFSTVAGLPYPNVPSREANARIQ